MAWLIHHTIGAGGIFLAGTRIQKTNLWHHRGIRPERPKHLPYPLSRDRKRMYTPHTIPDKMSNSRHSG